MLKKVTTNLTIKSKKVNASKLIVFSIRNWRFFFKIIFRVYFDTDNMSSEESISSIKSSAAVFNTFEEKCKSLQMLH